MQRIAPRALCALAFYLPVVSGAQDIVPFIEYRASINGGEGFFSTDLSEVAALHVKNECQRFNLSNCRIVELMPQAIHAWAAYYLATFPDGAT